MEQFVQDLIGGSQGAGAYLLVAGVLMLCGLGVPLPEDIVLIMGGYLAYEGNARLGPMIAVGYAGILLGDSIIYVLGRTVGSRLVQVWPFRRILSAEKRAQVEAYFERYGQRIVIAARFMPGVRAVTYFSAATVGMRYGRFILFDGLAALLSAPLFVLLGYIFGHQIEYVLHAVRRSQAVALGAIAGVVLLYVAWRLLRRRREAAARRALELSARLRAPKTADEPAAPSEVHSRGQNT